MHFIFLESAIQYFNRYFYSKVYAQQNQFSRQNLNFKNFAFKKLLRFNLDLMEKPIITYVNELVFSPRAYQVTYR